MDVYDLSCTNLERSFLAKIVRVASESRSGLRFGTLYFVLSVVVQVDRYYVEIGLCGSGA